VKRDFFCFVAALSRMHEYVRTRTGQFDGDRSANAGRTSRHDGGLTFQYFRSLCHQIVLGFRTKKRIKYYPNTDATA
jgi:hypothetical protein